MMPLADLSVFGDALQFMQDNAGLLVDKTVEHVVLSAAAVGIALLIALPIGLGLGHQRRYSFVAISISTKI